MKKKREELAAARKAWLEAKRAKKAKEEIEALYKTLQAKQAAVDEAEAAGEKDDDHEDGKTQDEKPQPGAKAEGALITMDELQTAIGKTVREQLTAALPDALKPQVTEESLKTIIGDAMAKFKKDHADKAAAGLNADDVKTIMSSVVTEQLAQITRASKMQHTVEEEEHQGKSILRIEIPTSWSKGNLPLHAKQLLNIMMKRPQDQGIDAKMLEKGKELGDRMMQKYVAHAKMGKALVSTTAGSGDEFVPTDLSSELQRRFYLASEIAAYFAARELDMPTQPWEFPLVTTRPTFLLESVENVAATESSPGTSKVTLDAKKIMGRTDYSYEMDEDSIIPVLPFVQEQLADAAADAYEDAIINGDTAATHQDTDYQAVAKHAARAFDGFRKLALAYTGTTSPKVSFATGGINEANLRVLKKRMKKYGIRIRDLIWIVGPLGKNDVEAIPNVSTLEKYGPRATILTGELASFLNIPIITSEKNREDLNASGVFDGVTTIKGSILLVNATRWLFGRRREFTVEVDRDIKTQTNFLVASFRRAMKAIETPSTATVQSLAIGYNYDS